VRVANELGRGNAKAAKFSIKIILSTSIVIGVVFWVLCLIFGEEISHFLTSDEEVAETVSSLVVLLAFSILLNSVQPVLTGKFFFLIFYDKVKWCVKSKLNLKKKGSMTGDRHMKFD
jgi:MATE family multidrug resistance protein